MQFTLDKLLPVVWKYLVSNISESKPFSLFIHLLGVNLGLKYSRLPKFIQKIYPNARMPMILMDSLVKFALYVFSHNIFIRLDVLYNIVKLVHKYSSKNRFLLVYIHFCFDLEKKQHETSFLVINHEYFLSCACHDNSIDIFCGKKPCTSHWSDFEIFNLN